MDRRRLLQMASAGAAAGMLIRSGSGLAQAPAPAIPAAPVPPEPDSRSLNPIRLRPDQIFRTTVCLRPFRAAGPRINAEPFGRKLVVHNYGHGGSGWSLSWGSAAEAVKLAMQSSPKSIAVIGAGAIGLTTALTAQRAGAQVTIYAKDRFPFVRSAGATGSWTPDSRVARASAVASDFADRWEAMARTSWAMHNSYVGLPGNPVEWLDQYYLRVYRPEFEALPDEPEPDYLKLSSRIRDIVPRSFPLARENHPFNANEISKIRGLTFNVADYAHQLTEDFLQAGGRFVPAEFHAPGEILKLKAQVIINCTGYGARALWKDETIIPYRGQISWLPPQEEARYGFIYKATQVLSRRDGIVVQDLGPSENFGMGDANETPDLEAGRASVQLMHDVYRI